MKPGYVYLISILGGFLLINCNRLDGKSFVPSIQGYAHGNQQRTVLKRPLREISGIDYVDENKLVAINDEAGKIFFIDPRNGNYEVTEFGPKGDYEEVVKVAKDYYVMNSAGALYLVNGTILKLEKEYANDFGKGVEFESMYYEPGTHQLILICKECGKNAKEINAWAFDINTRRFSDSIYFSIPFDEIQKLAKDNSIECKPSAAAIHPITKKLYIVASVGKILLECSLEGKLETVYGINPDHFQQPEGITFAPNGDLYISNEGVQGKATLLKFPYLTNQD
jgi:hypothetical protein